MQPDLQFRGQFPEALQRAVVCFALRGRKELLALQFHQRGDFRGLHVLRAAGRRLANKRLGGGDVRVDRASGAELNESGAKTPAGGCI